MSDAEIAQAAHDGAGRITDALNTGAGFFFGADAQMNRSERGMIIDPLERIMMRLPPPTLEAINTWADPMTLVIGLLAWAGRIAQLEADRAARNEPPAAKQAGPESSHDQPGGPPSPTGPSQVQAPPIYGGRNGQAPKLIGATPAAIKSGTIDPGSTPGVGGR